MFERLGRLFELGFKEKIITACSLKGVFFPVGTLQSEVEDFSGYVQLETKRDGLESFLKFYALGQTAAEFVIEEDSLKGDFFVNRILDAESETAGYYKNADVLLYRDGELFVYELTLGGGAAFHSLLVGQKVEDLPFQVVKGVSPDVNYGEKDFFAFLSDFLSFSETLECSLFYTEEIVKILQAYSYALSFLMERGEPVKKLTVRVVYPHREGVKQTFTVESRDKAPLYFERAVSLYRKFKGFAKAKPFTFEFWKKKAESISQVTFTVPKERSIDRIREEIKETVRDFDRGKLLLLLHPPGTGKTTAVLSLFESLTTPSLLFLFAPRRIIVEDKRKLLEGKGIAVIDDTKTQGGKRSVRLTLNGGEKKGRLKTVKDRLVSALKKGAGKVAVITTTQALVQVNEYHHTVRHFKEAVSYFFSLHPDGVLVLAVDELLGDEGSIPALKELISVLNSVNPLTGKKYLENTYLFGLDANLLNGEVADKVFRRLLENGGSQPGFVLKTKGENFYKGLTEVAYGREYFGIPTYSLTKPTFPTKEKVEVKVNFFPISGKTDLLNEIVKTVLKSGEGTYVYVQNKELAFMVSKTLYGKGFKTEVITATRRIAGKNPDFIISTSASARGVDVPFNKMVALLPVFGLEGQLAEILQAVSRIREKVEKRDKRITLLAPYREEEQELTFDELFGFIESLEKSIKAEREKAHSLAVAYKVAAMTVKVIESFISPNPDSSYFVPVPRIQGRKGKGFEFSPVLFLLEILKDRQVSVDLSLKVKFLPEVEPVKRYPFLYWKALAGFEFKDFETVERLLALVSKDYTIPKAVRKDVTEYLRVLLEQKALRTGEEVIYLAEYVPLSVYAENVKGSFLSYRAKTFGREERGTLRGNLRLFNGRIFIPVLDQEIDLPNSIKVPVEMFPI